MDDVADRNHDSLVEWPPGPVERFVSDGHRLSTKRHLREGGGSTAHFTALALLPDYTADAEAAVGRLLAPYDENGDCLKRTLGTGGRSADGRRVSATHRIDRRRTRRTSRRAASATERVCVLPVRPSVPSVWDVIAAARRGSLGGIATLLSPASIATVSSAPSSVVVRSGYWRRSLRSSLSRTPANPRHGRRLVLIIVPITDLGPEGPRWPQPLLIDRVGGQHEWVVLNLG